MPALILAFHITPSAWPDAHKLYFVALSNDYLGKAGAVPRSVRLDALADIGRVAQIVTRMLVVGVGTPIKQGEEVYPTRIGRGYLLLLAITP